MKISKYVLAVALLALMSVGMPTFGQVAEDCPLSSSLTWDAVTQDINGNPESILHYRVAVFAPLADVNVDEPLNITGTATTEITIAEVLNPVGLPLGTYRFVVKAIDLAGNESEWSEFLDLKIVDDVPPEPPVGLRCK